MNHTIATGWYVPGPNSTWTGRLEVIDQTHYRRNGETHDVGDWTFESWLETGVIKPELDPDLRLDEGL